MKKLFALYLLLFSLNSFAATQAIVYFIPFEVETYVPVTRETIVGQAWEKWTLDSDFAVVGLLSQIDGEEQLKFNQNRVRALVISEGQQAFVDASGIVSMAGKTGTYRIDKAAWSKIQSSLRIDQRKLMRNAN